jgi:2-oxoisovalerate dehydrogenase E2 component (dihydrolipoyl transacylase)
MTQQFAMPDVGEGLTEAEIVRWRVAVGDEVSMNQIIVEIETAKSVVELPSPYTGVVAELHHPEGAVVLVGEPIISIAANAALPAGPVAAEAPVTAEASVTAEVRVTNGATIGQRHDVLVGYGPSHRPVARRPRRAVTTSAPTVPSTTPHGYGKPPVRKLARDLGVDLRALVGTGPGGQISREDVARAAANPQPNVSATSTGQTRTPIRGVRKATADAMVASAFTAPHVTEWITVDVTRCVRLVARLRADRRYSNTRISPLLFVIRAVLISIARYPQINAKWDDRAQEIVEYRDVNLGIAAATPRGLMVPNIKNAHALTLTELAGELDVLVADARSGRTQPPEMAGGTFTITNIGVFGVDGATPILNPGEAAILCFGAIRKQPWNHDGKVRLRDVTTLSLSFDHRLVDGELGSQFLSSVAALLERPATALSLP